MAASPLTERALRRGLTTDVIGRAIVCLKSVGSTNDWLKAAAADGEAEGLAVFAEEQTAGHGQAGRPWIARPGRAILVSILLRPGLHPENLACLTMLGACAASAAITEVTGLAVPLKWPNDLVVGGRKLGGVLLEGSVVDGQVEHAILGIGLNVNLSRRALASVAGATSIQLQLGRPIPRTALARAILRNLDERYQLVRVGEFGPLIAEWRRRLATIGSMVDLLRPSGIIEGPFRAIAVTDRGGLILQSAEGSPFEVVAGEVSVRLA